MLHPILAAGAAPQSSLIQTIVMIAIFIAFGYLLIFRPEQKRRKAAQQMREAMKIGDKVTAMGMIGTIDLILDDTIVIKTYDGSKIEMLKGAISEIKGPNTSAK
ncbi:MAG TPA: preprotein translocase subunit YajC [Chlamydiales bacterium]|nr:preprotein translocase subunit YajC [Chlamydiales bacterium]